MKTVFCSTRNILMEETKSGAKMVCASNMLTKGEGGKIHVVHNKNDQSLLLSAVINMSARLGRQGLPLDGDGSCFNNSDEVHPEVKDHIVNVDWTKIRLRKCTAISSIGV